MWEVVFPICCYSSFMYKIRHNDNHRSYFNFQIILAQFIYQNLTSNALLYFGVAAHNDPVQILMRVIIKVGMFQYIIQKLNSMKSNLNVAWLLGILVICSSGLYVHIDQAPFCVQISPIPNSHYKLFYESISQKSTLHVTISSNSFGRVELVGPTNQKTLNASQDIEICFRTQSSVQPVSIDIYPTQQQKYKALALKSQVHEVHEELINVGTKLKQIAHHERFEQQRQVIQSQIISKQQNTIFIYSIIKVVLMVVVVGGQLFWISRKIGRNARHFFN